MEANLFPDMDGKEAGAASIESEGFYRQKRQAFKKYEVNTAYLFPLSTDDYISKNHIARLIHAIVDKLDLREIIDSYKGGGASAYSPVMLLSVWLLGFVSGIYTSRKLEQALKENIAFIWISGQSEPDFRTLNNFRLRLGNDIKGIFKQVVICGIQLGYIRGEEVFVDHTKLEANANSHKMIWKKQVDRRLEEIEVELDSLFQYIDDLNNREDKEYGDKGLCDGGNLDYAKIDEVIRDFNEQIKDMAKGEAREAKSKLKRTKGLIEKREGYKEKQEILGERKSYSRTDPDAVAMLQKDKESIKASYNEGIAVENGFVLDYEIGQNAADNVGFKGIIEGVIENIDKVPERVHADGAYGSEENMVYLEENGIENFLKYNTYFREHKKSWREEKLRREDFGRDEDRDVYICPAGKVLEFYGKHEKITATGYHQRLREYKAKEEDCAACALKEQCTRGRAKSIEVSLEYERLKVEARANLDSELGKELRRQRGNRVESIFGDRKFNKQYKRYFLRGLSKVNIESGLYYIAANIKKISTYLKGLFNIEGK